MNLQKFNWNTGAMDPFPVNEKAVERFVAFMLTSKAWHDDLELVHRRVRELKRDVEATLDNGMLKPKKEKQARV